MSAPHLSEFELEMLASGDTPTPAQQAALDASPELQAMLEERRQGLGAFPEVDGRQALAAVRRRVDSAEEETIGFAWGRLRDAFLGAALVGAALMAWVFLPSSASRIDEPREPVTAQGDVTQTLRLADGSQVTPRTGGQVVVDRVSERLVSLRMLEGVASFEVAKNPLRSFEVRAGDVVVRVVGTAFTLERSGTEMAVDVSEGSVRVTSSGTESLLIAGDRKSFSLEAASSTEVEEMLDVLDDRLHEEYAAIEPEDPEPTDAARPRPAAKWKSLASDGDHAAAYEALRDSGAAVRNEVADLMLAADTARLSGHPKDAVPYLQRIVREHAADRRAPAAALALGGVYLQDLEEPARAASMFATARKLAPKSPLASDALAREVRAHAQAGDLETARTRAQEYIRLFPKGEHVRSVRRYGRLD